MVDLVCKITNDLTERLYLEYHYFKSCNVSDVEGSLIDKKDAQVWDDLKNNPS